MDSGTRVRLIAIVSAATIVVLMAGMLLVVLFTTSANNFQAIAQVVIGFATPTVTTLLVFGTSKPPNEDEPNADEHNH